MIITHFNAEQESWKEQIEKDNQLKINIKKEQLPPKERGRAEKAELASC